MRIGDYTVERLLVEEQADIAREFYAAVLHDITARQPLILFSTEGGMDIEDIAAAKPAAIRRLLVGIDGKPSAADIAGMLEGLNLGGAEAQIARILDQLYAAYRARDAELLEINPLALLCRRPRGRARLQIRARRCGDLPAGRDRQRRRGRRHDRAGKTRRRGGPQADPARRQCRRAGKRRRAHHDHHGRDPPLWRPAGEFPRDRRRGLHQVRNRARSGSLQSRGEESCHQFLRRLSRAPT